MKNFRQQHRPKKSSLLGGIQSVTQAIESGMQLDRIYLLNTARGKWADDLQSWRPKTTFRSTESPVEKLNGFNLPDHGGIIGQLARIHYLELQEVISFVVEKGESPLFVVLDGITDIRNIGGIARTAYCCGVHALIIPAKGVGALQDDAILTSAGALEKIAVCRVNSLMKAVDELHLNGIRVFASEMTATKNVFECDFKIPCAILMGSEENGIFPALQNISDEKFKIPMAGDFESLNVGIATGMVLYEVMKQRMKG